jgi:HSP20 family protein
MIKTSEKTMSPVLAPFAQVAPDWFDDFGWKGLWRGLNPEPIKVEEFRENGTMVVRAEVPGVDPDKDIDITLQDDVLRIHVQREEKKEDQQKDRYRSEFRYGSFTRLLHVPRRADIKDVKASYREGILEVRVPADETKAAVQKVAIAH